MFLLTELRDLGHATRTGVQDQNQGRLYELRKRIVDEWDKLDQRIIDKAVIEWRKTERDVELVLLQEENSLNIRCEHFSLLTFCHVIFLKG